MRKGDKKGVFRLVKLLVLFCMNGNAALPHDLTPRLSLNPCQVRLLLPPVDQDGRRKALNKRGFADTRFNETQLEFIAMAKKVAQQRAQVPGRLIKQPMAVEVGMAYGDLGLAILTPQKGDSEDGGAFYLGVDMDKRHERIADQRLQDAQVHPSQYQTFVGKFPFYPSKQPALHRSFQLFQEAHEVKLIGAFSVIMYMNGPQLIRFLQWAYATLPSGGKLYLTGISPFCNLFPGYEKVYSPRRQAFIKDPSRDPFPGWVGDVRGLEPDFVPDLAHYLSMYPAFFHFLDPVVLEYYASQTGFVDIKAKFMRRFYPERLIYRGIDPPSDDVGEIASLVGTKP